MIPKKDTLPLGDCRHRLTLQRAIFRWYARRRRPLPWRKTSDPYKILVSEIMLQQTQVSRVTQKYKEFLKRFPTLASLARARTSSVIRAWSGLGYNARALRLQNLARLVVREYGGRIPEDPDFLLTLPGIGKYSANAIASFAFHREVPVVDTNIHRVLSRIFWRAHHPKDRVAERSVWRAAEMLLPRGCSRDWTLALMDLGATICTARRPLCAECPVSITCKSAFVFDGRKAGKRKAKHEPSYGGIPNRLYRGRIVEVLRNINGQGKIGLHELGRRIKTPFKTSEEAWLDSLLRGLEKDGLVRIHRRSPSGVRVSLP
jgi:A/G-specific adenine glycosylase